MVNHFLHDLRFGARLLGRQRGFVATVVLVLALGIGATTALFSVIEAEFLRPLPVANPDRLTLFSSDVSQGTRTGTPPEGVWTLFSSESYTALRDAPTAFEALAAFASSDDTVVSRLPGAGAAAGAGTRTSAHLVSGNYFTVMGVRASLGRTFAPEDDRAAAAPVAVISERFWRQAFAGTADVVGRTVMLNQVAFTVIGVMPPSFFGERVGSAPDVWAPLARQPEIQGRESVLDRPDYYWLSLIGRLTPGRTRRTGEADVTAALRRFLVARYGGPGGGGTSDRFHDVRVEMVDGSRGISRARQQDAGALMLLAAVVGLVLVVTCANVATLLLCRATSRQGEMVIRRALGASRGRLVRQWLTESTLLAFFGGAGGVIVAYWLTPALPFHLPAGATGATLNVPVLVFAAGTALLTGIVSGLAPALRAGHTDVASTLGAIGRGSRRRQRAWGATEPLIVTQIAVSLVLVLGAALFTRSLLNLERAPLGFEQDRVLLVRLDPRPGGYTPTDVGTLYRRLYDQVVVLPGVEYATFARYSPLGGYSSSFGASVDGYVPAPGETLRLDAVEVGPNYPQTLGMPLVAGRALGLDDVAGAPRVAMVNEAFVRQFFPTTSPLGRHVQLNDDFEIVGVVRDALFHSAREQRIPFVFVAMLQDTSTRSLTCEIELRMTTAGAPGLGPAVRDIVERTDSRVTVTRIRTLRAQVLATFGPDRAAAGLVGACAGLALLLAAVGIYGLISFTVAQRTREIGVRVALGAARGDIVWLVIRDTLVWLGLGITIGAIVAGVAGRAVAHQLFGVTATDTVSLVVATFVLAAVAVAASLIPSGRALRIHPVVALRSD